MKTKSTLFCALFFLMISVSFAQKKSHLKVLLVVKLTSQNIIVEKTLKE